MKYKEIIENMTLYVKIDIEKHHRISQRVAENQ